MLMPLRLWFWCLFARRKKDPARKVFYDELYGKIAKL